MENFFLTKIFKTVSLLILIVIFFFIFKYLLQLFYPFVIACIVAIIINPAVSFLERKLKSSRLTATLIVVIISLCFSFTILFLIVSELINGILLLSEHLPKYVSDFFSILRSFFQQKLMSIYDKFINFKGKSPVFSEDFILSTVDHLHDLLADTISKFIKLVLKSLHGLILKIPESIFMILLICVISLVVTYDYPYFLYLHREKLPKKISDKIEDLSSELKYLFKKYIQAQLLLSFITFLLTYVGLLIVQIHPSFTIAILIGIVDFLPVLGTSLIFIPWIVYLFLSGNYILTIKLSILYMIIVILRQIIEPKVLSNVFKIRFIYVLFIMFATYQLGGVTGIIFTPIIIIILIAFQRIGLFKFFVKFINE